MGEALWRPSPERVAAAEITRFTAFVNRSWSAEATDYPSLHRWSVQYPERFWDAMWDFAGIVAETKGDTVVEDVAPRAPDRS